MYSPTMAPAYGSQLRSQMRYKTLLYQVCQIQNDNISSHEVRATT